jgi:hypothetical protein
MPGEWETAPLSELCEQIADCPHSTPLWTNSGVIVLRNQNIRGGRLDLSSPSYTDEAHFEQRSRRARLKPGDLVLTREAPMGEVCMVPENLRPLAEQKAIAAVLGALDDKIELNRRMNATLEAMARALFQSWFVDFDPVRAKLDGRPPAALDPATAALFPEHLEDPRPLRRAAHPRDPKHDRHQRTPARPVRVLQYLLARRPAARHRPPLRRTHRAADGEDQSQLHRIPHPRHPARHAAAEAAERGVVRSWTWTKEGVE